MTLPQAFGLGLAFFGFAAWRLWRPAPRQVAAARATAGRSQPFDEVLLAPPAATGSLRARRGVIAVSGGFTARVPASLLQEAA